MKFEIPAQPAAAALMVFSKQARVEVVFSPDDLKAVRANEVMGEYEPEAALGRLLKDTGFTAQRNGGGKFVVKAAPPVAATGSIKGSLVGEGGRGMENVLVTVRETAQSAETNRFGEYVFPKMAAGTYVLVATASGYQPLHIVDVTVKAGRELTLGKEELRRAREGVLALEPLVVHADAVTELDKFEVSGTKLQPFTAGNVDIPRTINDAQPYYIFDSRTIERSGATSVEDLLKQRLTMNTAALSNAQVSGANPLGNISAINLRGLGADKTLILVNGRRMAGVTVGAASYQPDLNGIPLSAIDRIEVLPSSASGIYGGSAIGGVINVILKKDYAGGEIRATYDNTWNTDSPTRTVSASYGLTLEGGKTHVMLNASWSDAQPLLLQDRRAIFENNLATSRRNAPSTSRIPFQGALPNITNDIGVVTAGIYRPNNLILKPAFGGTTLSSGITHISAGIASTTTAGALGAVLITNAGIWITQLPPTTQNPTGLLRPFGMTPESKSFQASVSRQMLPRLELFADYSYNENRTKSVYNPFGSAGSYTVGPRSPISPFTTFVDVSVPDATEVPMTTASVSRSYTLGAIQQLPWGWTGEFDYSRSENRYDFLYYNEDSDGIDEDLATGALNPFVDALLHPVNMGKYLTPYSYAGRSTLDDFALRGAGPLWSLPWGTPSLTLGLEHRIARTPENVVALIYPITTDSSNIITYLARQSVTDSVYGEMTIPLAKKGGLPLVQALDLQLSGRNERYKVDTGTPSATYYPGDGTTIYNAPTLGGQPYYSKANYTSTNGTTGLRYQPVPDLTLRVSLATAFLPPTPDQLITNPAVDPFPRNVTDPTTGVLVSVQTLAGGNPGLKPQGSKSFNAGVIWEPRWKSVQGLRVNAEYYRIEQDDAISSLPAQTIVNLESTYPGRVTRGATGKITRVDVSLLNLYKRETEGWDLSVDYTLKTGAGTFSVKAVESIILHLKNQYAVTLPESDAVNFPSEGGAAKYKNNVTLAWEGRNWSAGLTTRYFSSYKQYGAVGGPRSTQSLAGAQDNTYIRFQGGNTIPSQTYQDLFASYAFGKQRPASDSNLPALGSSVLGGLTVQLGVRNLFNRVPPFDYFYSGNYFESPYGDLRLRTYWLSVKKTF